MKRSGAKPRKARPAEPSFLSNAKNAFERQETAKKWREKLSYYVYDENYTHRRIRAGNLFYKYDDNGNIICEQDGSFDSNDDGTYHKIQEESDEVYSTDYGWGLFRDDGTDIKGKHIRYKRMYSWNEKNMLVFSEDASHSTSYIYGHDGQRTNKYTRSSETLYFNNMWTLHTDAGNNDYGGQYAKNVYLGETRIVTKLYLKNDPRVDAEEVQQYFYHSDHLGSASLISDYKGDEYQRIEYTPYGETWIERTDNKGVDYLPYRFTAKELDEETGLYYYGARYLDPKYSMWISVDPAIGEYMGKTDAGMGGIYNHVNFNLYHYAGNNPINYTDPDGRAHFSKRPLQDTEDLSDFIKWFMSWKIFDWLDLELVHEHLFSDDGSGFNIGWTWGDYTFTEKEGSNYTKIPKYYDDELIKQAVKNVEESEQKRNNKKRDKQYSLAGKLLNNFLLKHGFIDKEKVGHKDAKKNNCQDYCTKIRREYNKLYRKLPKEKKVEIKKRAKEFEAQWKQKASEEK